MCWCEQFAPTVSQVLGEIFTSLHMAEAGSAAEGAADPQLPVCLRVPSRKAKPLWQRSLPRSTVLDLFGLQVQVRSVAAALTMQTTSSANDECPHDCRLAWTYILPALCSLECSPARVHDLQLQGVHQAQPTVTQLRSGAKQAMRTSCTQAPICGDPLSARALPIVL